MRRQWENLTQRLANRYHFFIGSVDGPALPQEAPLTQIMDSDTQRLMLYIDEQRVVEAVLLGHSGMRLRLTAHSLTTLVELKRLIKRHLQVDDSRKMRLTLKDREIDENVLLLNQLGPNEEVLVDLEMSILVKPITAVNFEPVIRSNNNMVLQNNHLPEDVRELAVNADNLLEPPIFVKEEKFEQTICLVSEVAAFFSSLINGIENIEIPEGNKEDDILKQRITVAGKNHEVSLDALIDDAVLLAGEITVLLESQMRVRIDDRIRGQQSSITVWPLSKVSDLVTSSTQCVIIDGQCVDKNETFWSAGILDGADLKITEILRLHIVDSKGHVHKLSTNFHQQGFELWQHLAQFEGNGYFQAMFKTCCLRNEPRTLAELGMNNSSVVNLVYRNRPVEVKKNGDLLTKIINVREGTTFAEFLANLNTHLGTNMSKDTQFLCSCGRIFSDESSQRRVFPIQCCEDAVLTFTAREPEIRSFRGRWTSSRFRIAEGAVSEALDILSSLSTCSREEWPCFEEKLVRKLLSIEVATEICVEADDRLDLVLEFPNNTMTPWSVRSSATGSDTLQELERLTFQSFSDFGVRGKCFLKVLEEPRKTFVDFKVTSGQQLTLVRSTADSKW